MTDFVTPVGRLIYGDIFKGSDKGFKNRLNDIDKNTGLPAIKWKFGIAVEKNNPELPAFMQLLQGAMRDPQNGWPNFKGNMSDAKEFSAKIEDGDKKTPAREGWEGCLIFKIESNYLPTVFAPDLHRIITNPEEVKKGYYVQVAGSYKTNGQDDKPGMKMWGSKVVFRYKGEEIKGSGGDSSCFNETGGYRPAGATDANAGFGGQQTVDHQQGSNQTQQQSQNTSQQQSAQGQPPINPNQPANANHAQSGQSQEANGASSATTSPSNQDWGFLNQ